MGKRKVVIARPVKEEHKENVFIPKQKAEMRSRIDALQKREENNTYSNSLWRSVTAGFGGENYAELRASDLKKLKEDKNIPQIVKKAIDAVIEIDNQQKQHGSALAHFTFGYAGRDFKAERSEALKTLSEVAKKSEEEYVCKKEQEQKRQARAERNKDFEHKKHSIDKFRSHEIRPNNHLAGSQRGFGGHFQR